MKSAQAKNIEFVFEAYPKWVAAWEAGSALDPSRDAVNALCCELHQYNYTIWNKEDVARRTDVGSEVIAEVKREIDKNNQKRNDTIERVDEWLLAHCYGHLVGLPLPMRAETPGGVLDRLSIIALKIFYMGRQTERADVGTDHIEACHKKLAILKEQQRDLQAALTGLLDDLDAGKVKFRIYRQFKMYNDQNLNPQLYTNQNISKS